MWVAQDLTDPSHYIAYLLQGGLGMPNRDYYVDRSPRMAALRDKYKAHAAAMLKLAGIADPEAKAAQILALETAIAKVHATRVESEDIKNGTVRWKRAELATRAPGLDWSALLDGAGLAGQEVFGVWHPKALTGIARAVGAEPLETWKAYLAFHAIDRAGPFLPKAFGDELFAFYGTALAGVPTQRDRAKRAIDITSAALGQPVGKLYVAKYFPAAAKQRITAMVKNILAAFDRRIDSLAWMTPATKAKAKAKLAVLKVGVGYPDQLARLPRTRGRQGRRVRQRRARLEVRVSVAARQARPAGRSRRVDDDAAAGQRGQPAGAQRDELSRRDPAAALLRSDRAPRRWTTARSAR